MEPQSQSSASEEEVAALIAAILIGSVIVPNPVLAIAQALLALVPGAVPAALSARLSADVARLVMQDPPKLASGLSATSAASRENLLYRARYGVAAVGRIVKAIRAESDLSVEERLEKALADEDRYFQAHKEASADRERGAALNDAIAAVYGPILNWNHTGTAKTHRPSHETADGKNYDVRRPPKSTEGLLPGQARHCDCVPGPPIPGARMMR